MTSALNNVAQSLKTLSIGLQFYGLADTFYEDPRFMQFIGGAIDFVNFEQLEKLEVPLMLLLGTSTITANDFVQRLLLSLRSVSVNDDTALFEAFAWRRTNVLKYFRESLPLKPTIDSKLQSLQLVLRESGNNWDFASKRDFGHIYSDAKLLYKIEEYTIVGRSPPAK